MGIGQIIEQALGAFKKVTTAEGVTALRREAAEKLPVRTTST